MKKRLLSVCLLCCLILTLMPLAAFASETTGGTCGDGLTWTLDAKGKLTVSGAGAMTDYSEDDHAPWYNYRERIVSAVLGNGAGAMSKEDDPPTKTLKSGKSAQTSA